MIDCKNTRSGEIQKTFIPDFHQAVSLSLQEQISHKSDAFLTPFIQRQRAAETGRLDK